MKYISSFLWESLLGVCFEGVLIWIAIYILFYKKQSKDSRDSKDKATGDTTVWPEMV